MPENQEIRVCCAVMVDGGKVLAARRGSHMSHALKWEFPGGKVASGESDEACLHRELAEELHVKLKVLQRLPEVRYAYPQFRIILVPFVCAVLGDPPQNREHHETGWFSYDELCQLNLTEADACLLPVLSDILRQQEPGLPV